MKILTLALLGCARALPDLISFRPPAVPLIVQDPYISVWSTSNHLYDTDTQHWSGATSTLFGQLMVDSKTCRFLGVGGSSAPPCTQVALSVYATSTYYTFSFGGVQLNVTFTTPAMSQPLNYSVVSLPATYISFSVAAVDGQKHAAGIYFDHDATLVTNNTHGNTTQITWERLDGALKPAGGGNTNTSLLRIGAAQQWPLDPIVCGQSNPLTGSQTIVWGWAYLAVDADATMQNALTGTVAARSAWSSSGSLPGSDATPPAAVGDGFVGPVVTFTIPNLPATGEPVQKRITFAIDEVLAFSYYANVTEWAGNPVTTIAPLWWRRDLPFNDTTLVPTDMLAQAHYSYDAYMATAAAFDAQLVSDLLAVGNPELATIGSMVARQVVGAQVLGWHTNFNTTWTALKEIASGGDFSTMDVIYPASPFWMVYNPALLATILLLPMEASVNTTLYAKPYVMHDVGKFPIANRPWGGQEDMPLEETGNLMLMLAAIAYQQGGNVSWLQRYFEAPGGMTRWAQFLFDSLPFPESQGTTDDFLQHCANATNLVWKGAAGLAAYGYLAYQAGNSTGAQAAWEYAGYTAAVMTQYGWYSDPGGHGGANASHFVWNYQEQGALNSSFLHYNALYMRALRMYNLLPQQEDFMQQQAAYYDAYQMGPYGVPLINGSFGTKADWTGHWAASLYTNSTPPQPHPQSLAMFTALLGAANATADRVPFTDFYDSRTAAYNGKYRARPVVGGIFAPLMVSRLAALPAMPHEPLMAAAFEAGHARAAAEQRQQQRQQQWGQ